MFTEPGLQGLLLFFLTNFIAPQEDMILPR